jgi:hypothetical protein
MLFEEQLFNRHVGKKVLLDSNLLVVLLTGAFDASLFGRFKRVSRFTADAYDFLVRFVRSFSTLLTTPHILTEVSNLANSLQGWQKVGWIENFAALISSDGSAGRLREHWSPASNLAQTTEFSAFGITDAALSDLSSDALVVTEDYRLSGVLRRKGRDVINFRDLRDLWHLIDAGA